MKPKLITHNGKTQSVSAWAREYGISAGALNRRIKAGWEIEKALSEPYIDNTAMYEYKGKMYTVRQLADMHGNICISAMRARLKTHTVEEALSIPNNMPRWKPRISEKRKTISTPSKKPDTKRCKTCIYHGTMNDGSPYCGYIEVEMHRRPCKPGEQCTVYKAGKSMVRKMAIERSRMAQRTSERTSQSGNRDYSKRC